jgi:hypothetical protein
LSKESLGYYELKKHKPWFSEGCSEVSDQRKQAKLHWLEDPNEINGDNLNNTIYISGIEGSSIVKIKSRASNEQ